MTCQIVLQFKNEDLEFDGLIELEEALRADLGDEIDVDGHDFGSGEGNIFIFAEDAQACFAQCKRVVDENRIAGLTAAYRDMDDLDERFVLLWPPGSTTFDVK